MKQVVQGGGAVSVSGAFRDQPGLDKALSNLV